MLTFYIINQLNNALKQRIKSHLFLQQRFRVLTEFDSMSDEDIKTAIERLVEIYPKDLSFEFYSEFCQLFAGTRNSQKNTAKKSQEALLNILFNFCT